jgi:tetratricopeptide (TPR) repeat protein
MNNEKSKTPPTGKQHSPASASPARSTSAPAKPKVNPPPLFRKTDWLTFLITFGAVWVAYYLTLAPELTLEDSGELATGSFYAGIPHPPGYPVWTIYTWLWTLLPIKNIAWRVALGEATGGAIAAGLLGLLVSRGSSLLIEGIEDLKAMAGRWESLICIVSGFVAGTLIGFNGFMWSQSVIVEVYAFSVASFMVVLLCLLRWIYAPHQRQYLWYALFFHGICFTNHQTLIVAAMGIEVAIAAADFRMGREMFLGNSVIYLAGLILKQQHILTALEQNAAIYILFNVIGIASMIAYLWFTVLTRETFPELCRDACWAAFWILAATAYGLSSFFVFLMTLVAGGAFVKFAWDTRKFGKEWAVVLIAGICWIGGALFYFYMPLAGMTNPPMEWGYPRTVEGFIHAFTRGQYEKTNPTDIIHDPGRFFTQLGMLFTGIVDEFNWVYVFVAIVPFVFFLKLHRRERAWIIGITGIYLCLGVLLLILLNPVPDRAAQELVRVFFTSSHTLISLLIGYGLTLIAAYMATHYERFRSWGLIGAAAALALALYSFTEVTKKVYFGDGAQVDLKTLFGLVGRVFTNKHQYGLPVYAGLILVGMAVALLVSMLIYRKRAPLAITLAIFAMMPLHSVLTHWSDNEQRGHMFGYWFGHDMFTPPFKGADGKPLYPEMTKDAVLFGGTDPGRFCPTYMIFCESFTPHKCQPIEDQTFDRRDVYIITQNALADGTYLSYIRAQYNRSTQIDPPFFQELFRSGKEREQNYTTNILARMVQPLDTIFEGLGDRIEKERRVGTSWFTEKDFLDFPAFIARLRPGEQQDAVSKFLYENLSPETKQMLSGDSKALKDNLCKDLNRLMDRELQTKKLITAKTAEKSALEQELANGNTSTKLTMKRDNLEKQIGDLSKIEPLYLPERFKDMKRSEYLTDFIKENPQLHTRVRLNRLLLEAAYPKEIARSIGGLYPDREIYTPTVDDSQKCFNDYLVDAQRRLQLNQLKPGEDVKIVDNRVQVSGQVAVMAINGLLTKVIFDHNPKNEFFVEESFPLDWMYPYLTPFAVIMKINRQPLPELTDEIVAKDHDFWKQFSKRLTGDIVDYDTPVKTIADWIEKVYLHRDFKGFTGDTKFVRDDQAQKAFSKLRSSIGGIYAWRVNDPNNQNPVARARMIKEADFAFRQAFAFCPYSPEAVFRYVQLLLSLNRLDDALIIAETCLKLDPFNGQVQGLVKNLHGYKSQSSQLTQNQQAFQANLAQLEKAVQENPTNLQSSMNLAMAYMQMQQTGRAIQVLEAILNRPNATPQDILAVAQAFNQMGNYPKLEETLEKLTKIAPQSPEAFYDLASLKVRLGKTQEVAAPLKHALEMSIERHAKDPAARDIVAEAKKDPALAPILATPEFKALLNSK